MEGPLLDLSPANRALRESIARYAADADGGADGPPRCGSRVPRASAIHQRPAPGQQAFIPSNARWSRRAGSRYPRVRREQRPTRARARRDAPGAGHSRRAAPRTGRTASRGCPGTARRGAGGCRGVTLNAPRRQFPTSASSSHLGAARDVKRAPSKAVSLLERRQLRVPSLAERPEDVAGRAVLPSPALAPDGAVVETISDQSMKRLRKSRWPGDVRKLQSLIERSVNVARKRCWRLTRHCSTRECRLATIGFCQNWARGAWQSVARPASVAGAAMCDQLIRPGTARRDQTRGGNRALPLEAKTIVRLTSPEHRAALRFRCQ